MGGHTAAHWNPDTEDWSVHSATDPNTVYRVWRKRLDSLGREQSEKQQKTSRGWWWFALDCNCPAIVSSGYAVCKHKACVRLWQLRYQRRDGREWGTLPAHSNRAAKANASRDPDGIETWKDKEPRVREPDVYCDCPDDPCMTEGCPCAECERLYAAPIRIGKMLEGVAQLTARDDLPW